MQIVTVPTIESEFIHVQHGDRLYRQAALGAFLYWWYRFLPVRLYSHHLLPFRGVCRFCFFGGFGFSPGAYFGGGLIDYDFFTKT
jgi:hypothetical protein